MENKDSRTPPTDGQRHFSLGPVRGIPVLDADSADFVELHAMNVEAAEVVDHLLTQAELSKATLEDSRWMVRVAAMPRLTARFPDAASAAVLLRSLDQDPVDNVRCAAANALTSFVGDAEVESALCDAMRSDASADVRYAAWLSLEMALPIESPTRPLTPPSSESCNNNG